MTVHLVTFSDECMSRSRALCASSAEAHGCDNEWQYEQRFMHLSVQVREHPEVFRQPEDVRRAWAWWAWKPVIIQDAMRRAAECYSGEQVIVYADAGVEFINNVSHIIDRMDQDIFLFGNNWENAHWCKRDIIDTINPIQSHLNGLLHRALVKDYGSDDLTEAESAWRGYGKQVQASVIFFRVSDYSRKFVAEWLKWCLFEGRRLIDDSPSRTPNHPEFQENRHDQAILTTMAYREGIRLHYWPAVYNKGGSPEFIYEKLPEYAGDDYPVLFSHHRKRNHEWQIAAA